MLKLAIAFIAVVAVLSTVVTAVNQVVQSVTPIRFWWMRRGLNVGMRNLGLGDGDGVAVRVREWLGIAPHRWTREALRDPWLNPTSSWWPDWIYGEAFRRWLDTPVEGRPEPVAWARDPERFLAWWAMFESAQTRGFKRMLLGLSAAIGIAMCIWIGLDPKSLARTLQDEPQLLGALAAGPGEGTEGTPDFGEFSVAFEARLAEQPGQVSAKAAGELGRLAAVYFRDAEGTTLAERSARVAAAFEELQGQRPGGLTATDVDAGVAAAQATWRGYASSDPDLLSSLRGGPRFSWGALLMGCLVGFGAPFWFELLEAIIAGVRGRRYRAIAADATDQSTGTGGDDEV